MCKLHGQGSCCRVRRSAWKRFGRSLSAWLQVYSCCPEALMQSSRTSSNFAAETCMWRQSHILVADPHVSCHACDHNAVTFPFAGLMRRQPRATPRASAAASAATPGGDSSSAGKQFSDAFYRTRLLTFAAMFIGYGRLLNPDNRCKYTTVQNCAPASDMSCNSTRNRGCNEGTA